MHDMAREQSTRATLNPILITRNLFSRRSLIWQLSARELQQSWRDSLLGAAWMILQPLLTLAVYATVFTVLFVPRRGPEGQTSADYVLDLFCGLVVFWVFSETVARAPTLIGTQPAYVKKVVFPLEVLPVTVLAASLVNMLGGIAILLVAVGIVKGSISTTLWAYPLILLPLILGTLGVSWFLAALGVYVRDMLRVVSIGLQFLLYLSPVIWRLDWLPENLRPFAVVNPFTPILESSRAVLIEGGLPSWPGLAAATALGLVLFVLGHAWFARARWGFADVL
jgi:lipopolysaccharide transport system permease protein